MSERIFRLSDQHGVDSLFRLHYGQDKKILNPFEPIPHKDLCLGIIENGNLVPGRLMIHERDRELVKLTIPQTSETIEFTFPGKSAILVLDRECCNRNFAKKLARNYLEVKKPDKDHHLHLATVKDVENAGWIPHWVPYQLEWKILHVVLVAQRTLEFGEEPDITHAEALKKAFSKIC